MGFSLADRHVVQDLVELVWLYEVPEALCTNYQELICRFRYD